MISRGEVVLVVSPVLVVMLVVFGVRWIFALIVPSAQNPTDAVGAVGGIAGW